MVTLDIKLKRNNFDVCVNETFYRGITGIFGPSGSGKTSMMHAIAGLAKPYSGNIVIYGRTVFHSELNINVPVHRRQIGYVFQEGRLFPHMTVKKNLTYGIKKGLDQQVSFNQVVDMLNLEALLHKKPADISGGERQRTALGRALLSSPCLLLLDEPFSAVDMQLRNQILPFLLNIHQLTNIPVLVVSHDMPDLLKLTDNLCLIQNGKCVGHGKYYDLLNRKHVQDLMGRGSIINSIALTVDKISQEQGITVLSSRDKNNSIKVLCEKSKKTYRIGQDVKIFIHPDDIALSAVRLESVTIQNQLQGVITDIFERDDTTLCAVDVGFRLFVEITKASLKRMDIGKGKQVWCLFKSVAIDVAG